MPRTRKARSEDWLFPKAVIASDDEPQSSLLDVVDSVLNKGAVVNGDVILGLANVDLVYARLSVLLTGLGRLLEDERPRSRQRRSKKSARRRRK